MGPRGPRIVPSPPPSCPAAGGATARPKLASLDESGRLRCCDPPDRAFLPCPPSLDFARDPEPEPDPPSASPAIDEPSAVAPVAPLVPFAAPPSSPYILFRAASYSASRSASVFSARDFPPAPFRLVLEPAGDEPPDPDGLGLAVGRRRIWSFGADESACGGGRRAEDEDGRMLYCVVGALLQAWSGVESR